MSLRALFPPVNTAGLAAVWEAIWTAAPFRLLSNGVAHMGMRGIQAVRKSQDRTQMRSERRGNKRIRFHRMKYPTITFLIMIQLHMKRILYRAGRTGYFDNHASPADRLLNPGSGHWGLRECFYFRLVYRPAQKFAQIPHCLENV